MAGDVNESTPTSASYAPRLPLAQRRTQILDAALDLVAESGLGAVNMEAVAARVGVSKPVVYKSFDNTECLLRALLEREEERGRQQVHDIAFGVTADPDRDPVDGAVNGALAFFDAVHQYPGTWRLILSPDPALDGGSGERVTAHTLIAEVADTVEGALAARQSGPMNVELATRLLFSGVKTGAQLLLEEPPRFTVDEIKDFAAQVVRSLVTS